MSKTKNIGYNLSLLRKSLKLSQANLADEINVSKSMINHIENSENDSALVHYIYYLRITFLYKLEKGKNIKKRL